MVKPKFVAIKEASGAEMQVASPGGGGGDGGGGPGGEAEGWAAARTSAVKIKLRISM